MDIFAFGVMMYQLITDEYPFGPLTDENELVIYIKNAREGKWDPKRLAINPVGKEFEKVISGCLISDFKQRLQTVDMVLSLMHFCQLNGSLSCRHAFPSGRHHFDW